MKPAGGKQKSMVSGSALILALTFAMVLAILVGGYLAYVNGQARILKEYINRTGALYLAEAGIEKAVVELEGYSSPPPTYPGIEETEMGEGTYLVESAAAEYIDDVVRYELHSTGSVSGAQREVTSDVQTDTFAKYIYFTNSENYLIHWWWWWFDVPVWFTSGSYLEGIVHTNGQYNISGYPVFNGPVSSVSDSINYMHGPGEDGIKFYDDTVENYDPELDSKFEPDELNLGVSEVSMSFLNADNLIEGSAQPGGITVSGDTTVSFLSDGTMNVTNAGEGWEEENMPVPENGALFVNGGDLYISGTLNGTLTVGAGKDDSNNHGNVIITDNVVYNSDPETNPDSTDKLGIIAEEYVIVDSNAPYDLEIDASIIAIGESFTVEDYWDQMKGVLTVYGGIIQDSRGPVGTFNSYTNEKVSGYDKNYRYDQRMRYSPPPFFPLTGEYTEVYWSEG